MILGGFVTGRRRACACLVSVVATVGSLALVLPATSGASTLTWGPDLSAPVTLDTANGDHTAGENVNSPKPAIAPVSHSAEDLGVWNDGNRAPAGGQVLQVNVKGCAVEDKSAPTQDSTDPGPPAVTVPVNTIVFQSLVPSGSNWTAAATSGQFTLPFCSDSQNPDTGQPVNTSTVNQFQPVHMCIAPGGQVALHDIGGFIPSQDKGRDGGPWYTQGIPLAVIASASDTIDSFVGVGVSTYGPGLYGSGDTADESRSKAGYANNAAEQVQLQVIEGVGDDAYGQCPGGDAVEPSNANNVVCVTRSTGPNDPYGTCNTQQHPVRPPRNQSPPTISVSSNGALVPGNRMDATAGTWTQDPNQSFISYAYQWEDCDSGGANCTPIGGQASKNPYYYATTGDVGHTIEVAASATNNANAEGPVNSSPTSVVSTVPLPQITSFKLNPSTWNEAASSVITYGDSENATSIFTVLQNGSVVRTFRHDDGIKNGIPLGGLSAGRYQLQVTPTYLGAVGPAQTLPFTITSATPVVTSVKINPSSFNSAKGATVTYVDSVAGNEALSVVQCQKRKKGVCTKYKTFKTIRHSDRAGANGVKLAGVAVGHYQLELVSTYAGHKSLPVFTSFAAKLVKSKRRHKRHDVRHTTLALGGGVAAIFG
jgi:hypothetical protein